jgi:acyl carrier protein
MIPHFFFHTKKIELGTTGKFDLSIAKKRAIKAYKIFEGTLIKNHIKIKVRNHLDKLILNTLKRVSNMTNININTSFKLCGMDSLMSVGLVSILRNKNIDIQYEDVFKTNNVEELANLISNRHPASSLVDNFKNKQLLIKYVNDYSFKNNMRHSFKNRMQNILLTGGNGFLGSNLICALLEEEEEEINIYCPIRARKTTLAIDKIINHFSFQFTPKIVNRIVRLIDKRLFIFPIQDYSIKYWGLGKSKYNSLQNKIDTVIHCAANVNHFTKLNDALSSNVDITKSIAKFSSMKHIKLFHISSMSVSSIDFPDLNANDKMHHIKKFTEKSL